MIVAAITLEAYDDGSTTLKISGSEQLYPFDNIFTALNSQEYREFILRAAQPKSMNEPELEQSWQDLKEGQV